MNNRELIKLQRKELFYIGYYFLFLLEFIKNLFIFKSISVSYKNVSFLQERRLNEECEDYLKHRDKRAYRYVNCIFHCKYDMYNNIIFFLQKDGWTQNINKAMKQCTFAFIDKEDDNIFMVNYKLLINLRRNMINEK